MGASTGIVIGTRFPVAFTLVYSLQWFAHGSIFHGEHSPPLRWWICLVVGCIGISICFCNSNGHYRQIDQILD